MPDEPSSERTAWQAMDEEMELVPFLANLTGLRERLEDPEFGQMLVTNTDLFLRACSGFWAKRLEKLVWPRESADA